MFRLAVSVAAALAVASGQITLNSDTGIALEHSRDLKTREEAKPAAGTLEAFDPQAAVAKPKEAAASAAEPLDVEAATATATEKKTSSSSTKAKTSTAAEPLDVEALSTAADKKPSSSSTKAKTSTAAEPLDVEALSTAADATTTVKKTSSSSTKAKTSAAAEPLDVEAVTKASSKARSSKDTTVDKDAADKDSVEPAAPVPKGNLRGPVTASNGTPYDTTRAEQLKLQKLLKRRAVTSQYIDELKGYLALLKDTRQDKTDDKEIHAVEDKIKDAYKEHLTNIESELKILD